MATFSNKSPKSVASSVNLEQFKSENKTPLNAFMTEADIK